MKLKFNRVGLGRTQHQEKVAEFSKELGYWIVWLSYDADMMAGTYVELRPDGSTWRITVDRTGEVVRTIRV